MVESEPRQRLPCCRWSWLRVATHIASYSLSCGSPAQYTWHVHITRQTATQQCLERLQQALQFERCDVSSCKGVLHMGGLCCCIVHKCCTAAGNKLVVQTVSPLSSSNDGTFQHGEHFQRANALVTHCFDQVNNSVSQLHSGQLTELSQCSNCSTGSVRVCLVK